MATRQFTTRTPGAPVPASEVADQDLADVMLGSDESPAASAGQDTQLTMSDAMEAHINRMIAKGVAAQLAASSKAAAAVTPAELPDHKDIDPAQITEQVLTKQGYVLPLVDKAERAQLEREKRALLLAGKAVAGPMAASAGPMVTGGASAGFPGLGKAAV